MENSSTYWRCTPRYCREAGRTATAVDSKLPITWVISLRVNDRFLNRIWHCSTNLFFFPSGSSKIMSFEFVSTSKNSKILHGCNIDFLFYSRNPNPAENISHFLQLLSVPLWKLPWLKYCREIPSVSPSTKQMIELETGVIDLSIETLQNFRDSGCRETGIEASLRSILHK